MERLGAEQDAGAVMIAKVAQGDYSIHGTAAVSFSVSLQVAGHVSSYDWPGREKQASVLVMIV